MPRFASQPSPAAVRLGDNQAMACEVNSDLVPFARWEKDRLPLEPSARLVRLPSGALVIANATEADAGLYRCLVENAGSSKASDEAQLQVLPGSLFSSEGGVLRESQHLEVTRLLVDTDGVLIFTFTLRKQ